MLLNIKSALFLIDLKSNISYFYMAIVVFVWGISWPIGRIVAISDVGIYPFTISFLRYAFAIPILVILTRIVEKEIKFPRHLMKKISILGLLQISLYQIFFLLGVRYTSSSDAVLIINGGITLVTAVLSAKLYVEEKLDKYRITGISLAFMGVFLIFLFSPNEDIETRVFGNLLIMMAAIVFGVYTVLSKPIYKEISPLNFQVWATLIGWLILSLFSIGEQFIAGRFVIVQFSTEIMLWIVYLGAISAAIGNTLYSMVVKNIGPTRASLFINFMPIAGVLSAVWLLEEKISYIYLIAFIIIFTGIMIEKRSSRNMTN